jgi:hypothetical protein
MPQLACPETCCERVRVLKTGKGVIEMVLLYLYG